MSTDDQKPEGVQDQGVPPNPEHNQEDIEARIQNEVDARLKTIKENLDKAYGERDKLRDRLKEFERKEQEAKIKQMEEEGRHKEAMELRLAEKDAELSKKDQMILELTRDSSLNSALSGFEFQNPTAKEVARQQLVRDLIQNEKGEWMHKAGKSLTEAVTAFADDEQNAFLFKPKQSSGSGSKTLKPSQPQAPSSVFDIPQSELLEKIRKGENYRK